MHAPIYMDCHATTPVDPRVLELMLPYFTQRFGNAASRHHLFGWQAEKAVDVARGQVASLLGAGSGEIIFTSGATEANNLAILGVAETYGSMGRHIITQATEHSAVLDPIRNLEQRGFEVTILPVNQDGQPCLVKLADSIREDTILVSMMSANNEVGTVLPIRKIGQMCHERKVIFHTDAAQACGRLPIHVQDDNIDLLSLSGHKLYGPKGIGALYVRRKQPRVRLAPQMWGGGHEKGLRSGTLNVPAIVGLGEACRLVRIEGEAERERVRALTSELEAKLRREIGNMQLNGPAEGRLPGNLNISIPGLGAERMMLEMRELAISSGAACSSAQNGPSHVLQAMGHGIARCHESLRFGLGRFTTQEELERAVQAVARAYGALKREANDSGVNAH